MATPEALGSAQTSSAPCFNNGMIWYQEDGSGRLMVMPIDDPSKAVNPGGLKTLSEPVLAQGRYITFRGEDDRLMLVTADAPHMHGQLGDQHCLSAPVPAGGAYLYFQGRGNSLDRCRLDRDEHAVQTLSGQPIKGCLARPGASARMHQLFYRAINNLYHDDFLYVVNTEDGTGGPSTSSDATGFYTAPNGAVWFCSYGKLLQATPGVDWHTYELHADPVRPCATLYGTVDYIYYVYYGDLYRAPIKNPADDHRELIAKGCATPPDVQIGFVLYGGTDKKIYKVST